MAAVPALPRALPARAPSAGRWAQHSPAGAQELMGQDPASPRTAEQSTFASLGAESPSCQVKPPQGLAPAAGTGTGAQAAWTEAAIPILPCSAAEGAHSCSRAQGQGAPPRGDPALPVAAGGGTGTAQLTPSHHSLTLLKQPSVPPHDTCAVRTGQGPGAHRALALTTKQKPIAIIFRVRGPWCPRSPRRSTSCCAITSPAPMRAPATSTACSGGRCTLGKGESRPEPY